MARTGFSSSDYLSRDSAIVSSFPFSVACWFYASTSTATMTMFFVGNKDVNDEYYVLESRSNNVIRATRQSDNSLFNALATTATFNDQQWHHALAVFAAADDVRLYLDGGNKVTTTTNIGIGAWDRTAIGVWAGNSIGAPWDGRLAEVVVWDVALSDADAAALGTRRASAYDLYATNRLAHYPLWGHHSPEIDSSSNGNSLTITGALSKANHAPVRGLNQRRMARAGTPLIEVAAPVATLARSQAIIIA